MQIRAATVDDLGAVQAIYAHHVLHGLGTFETEPPDLAEMKRRHAQIVGDGFPYLVAVDAGRVQGYAYANHFRTRAAYRNKDPITDRDPDNGFRVVRELAF